MAHGVINLANRRFGRLQVLHEITNRPKGGALWQCQCDCGQTRPVRATLLLRGRTRSCGCLRRERARRLGARSPPSVPPT